MWTITVLHAFIVPMISLLLWLIAICILFMNVYWDCLLIEMWTITVYICCNTYHGKSILEVPDTGTWVSDNTRPFLHSSIVSFWITPACSKERKYHISRQYWYTRNVPVFTNTGTFQYLGPEVYFSHCCYCSQWLKYLPFFKSTLNKYNICLLES